MDELSFTVTAWKQYLEWQEIDKKIAGRINDLVKDIQRNGFMKGPGKPKGRKAYSRRIDDSHRLVYTADEHQNLKILSCKGHYQ